MKVFFVSFSLLLLCLGCASSLKSEKDLKADPRELTQKMTDIDVNQLKEAEMPVSPKKSKRVESPLVTLKKTVESRPSESKKKSISPRSKVPADPTWVPDHWSFGFGESSVYAMSWGFIEAGRVTIEVLNPQMLDGVPVFHYRAVAKSSEALNLFYKFEDSIDSWVGATDHLPRRQEIKQLESAQWGKRVVVFDTKEKKARYFASGVQKSKGPYELRQDDPVEYYAQDIFGALFFYRFINNLENVNFAIHDRFRNWNNRLTIVGKESIKTGAGTFPTIHIKMQPRISGNLEPKGDVEIWVKDDPSKLLVQFKAKIKVGSLMGELLEHKDGQIPNLPTPVMKTPINLNDMGQQAN